MRVDPPRGPDVATLLARAMRARAQAAGLTVAIRSVASRPWASATFVGMRHRLAVEAPPGATLAAWIAALPEAEWSIRGHLVADLVVDAIEAEDGAMCATLAILTIDAD